MNLKRIAAEKAVEFVEDGMKVGLGTGSTAYWAICKLGELVKEGLSIQAVATSLASEKLAQEHGVPLIPFAKLDGLDLTIDGADELDHQLRLIKGGGGALLREKIVAFHSKQLIIVADESKLVDTLGTFPLPVEIVSFAMEWTMDALRALHCKPMLRTDEEKLFVTDNGNYIADCHFEVISDAEELQRRLMGIPGIVDQGLFLGMASKAVIGHSSGHVNILER
ncbi:ribose-5-phosphate isomerase RpiA [Paenibacillus pini]|uniref:Ribose-5-phosphate isomerase A n=1 Tax=Paenibacillus pini JCM 16418 TaxID=1236976 RepID=W7Y6X5_9BACL|nr:ribose-5-phosphate isomerase RpiA [Paenibacillus pini]GAF06680.1 ribose 5-phosphate isomerase A [Paenibacillus pini JCM 16418]